MGSVGTIHARICTWGIWSPVVSTLSASCIGMLTVSMSLSNRLALFSGSSSRHFIDDETAKYLLETMPSELGAFNDAEVADQLVQARGKKNTKAAQGAISLSFEERVAEAIASLLGRPLLSS